MLQIDEFLADRDTASQILRQHIILGKWTMENLTRMNTFYTLQGKAAEIQIKSVSTHIEVTLSMVSMREANTFGLFLSHFVSRRTIREMPYIV